MTVQPIVPSPDESSSAREIYRQLRGLILAGHLGAGERLPPVRQTATDLGVAPGTAAKAYKMLENEGLVVTRTAAGTRVSASAAILPLPVLRHIRALIESAEENGSGLDDVAGVLRAIWQARTF
ncbi:HTH-type transcriptional repressor YtrA [Microbacterium hydrocarbonoxydans]|uniref:HTH-type transcriptional repressor YtrA n=1 Tax=Microbacterium hydrocarbonoxydans TaxID=273678 RepID=A0A0M2HTE1_9MICO|nr:GntR family transcriptional regulator [Microbacterium hydrocarbonoxydans]KJL47744.1 HTH-type transcriptional repressor YtrA [Microbacterium hydrocarbonoxydans]